MAAPTYTVPTNNADTATEEPKVTTALSDLKTLLTANLDAANMADSAVTTAKITDASVTNAKTGFTWTTWTPTWANITVGNGTVVARHCTLNKLCHFTLNFRLGTTSSVGTSPTFTLPATSRALDAYASTFVIGTATIVDLLTATYSGACVLVDTTHGAVVCEGSTDPFTQRNTIAVSTPMTWTTGDEISARGFYEVA